MSPKVSAMHLETEVRGIPFPIPSVACSNQTIVVVCGSYIGGSDRPFDGLSSSLRLIGKADARADHRGRHRLEPD